MAEKKEKKEKKQNKNNNEEIKNKPEEANEKKEEQQIDNTMVTAQEDAVSAVPEDKTTSEGAVASSEDKTVMLENEGTVVKEIIPENIEMPEKLGILTILGGQYSGKKYEIEGKKGTEIRIGRDNLNDFVVKGEGVSRYHAKIVVEEGKKIKLVDLNSRNGTFVNGKKIKEVVLKGGEKILFGDVPCRFEPIGGIQAQGNKKILIIAASAVVAFLFILSVFKMMSGGKEKPSALKKQYAAQNVSRQPKIENKNVIRKAEKKSKERMRKRLMQKLTIARKEFQLENYDDAMQIAQSILDKAPNFKPAKKLIREIEIAMQDKIDKEIIKKAEKLIKENKFDDAGIELKKIKSTSSYFEKAKKYLAKVDSYPKAKDLYKNAKISWKKGDLEEAKDLVEKALEMIPEYKKPQELKEKIEKLESLLSEFSDAESKGNIKDIEKLAKEIEKLVKVKDNKIYVMVKEKLNKLVSDKYYKANRYYLMGMKFLAEAKYFSALKNFDKARQLLPDKKIYDIRYKETMQKINKKMKSYFYAAYILAENDPSRSKEILQKIIRLGMEDNPYYQKALKMLEE